MNRTIRIAGLLLASLTISTVALAQQGGGGGGGRGGGDGGSSSGGAGGGRGGEGGGGDSGVIEFLLTETEKARLTRAVERRRANPRECLTHACNEPPPPPPPRRTPRGGDGPADIQRTFDRCGGGDTVLVYRGHAGQIVRYACDVRR